MSPRLAIPAIAGWLFADLLLAFAIVVLGTQEPTPVPKAVAASSPSPSPTPPARQALERRYVRLTLTVPRGRSTKAQVAALRKAVRAEPRLEGRKAGIVLTFGAEHDGGEKFARSVNELLERVDGRLFADVATRDFQLIGASGGAVILQIYLFHAK
ncbi:hypothetical protein [Herbidospora mongoliensis]|uniref:hypothetical protein n=1 Tax=Herbidospora mongoliensis TaxID=688067 RepID=UPI00082E278C|nr:hypothetical protein [Herbidospora mongoliensis]